MTEGQGTPAAPAAPGRWERGGPDEVAYDGFVRVVRRPVVLPHGGEAVWDILDTPATVSVLALTAAREVVLVQQFRPGPDRVVLSLPGGLVDEGESPVEAGLRELLEETGYTATTGELVASVDPPGHTRPRHTVVVRSCEPTGIQQLDPLEDITVVLMPVQALRRDLGSGRFGTTEQTYLALDHLGLL